MNRFKNQIFHFTSDDVILFEGLLKLIQIFVSYKTFMTEHAVYKIVLDSLSQYVAYLQPCIFRLFRTSSYVSTKISRKLKHQFNHVFLRLTF